MLYDTRVELGRHELANPHTKPRHRIEIGRDEKGDGWIANVIGLDHDIRGIRGKTIKATERNARLQIGKAKDAVDAVCFVLINGRWSRQLETLDERLEWRDRQRAIDARLALDMSNAGYSLRDIATLTRVSTQRVSQRLAFARTGLAELESRIAHYPELPPETAEQREAREDRIRESRARGALVDTAAE